MAVALKNPNTVEVQEKASTIGEVREKPKHMVVTHTRFGVTGTIDMLVGDPLSRSY